MDKESKESFLTPYKEFTEKGYSDSIGCSHLCY